MSERIAAPDGGYGWIIVVANTIISISVTPALHCFGLLFKEKFETLGITASQTSLIISLSIALGCIPAMAGGILLRRYSYRVIAIAGVLLTCFGVCLTSYANSLITFILSYCILIGIGTGIIFPATNLALYTYFSKRRTLATGFVISAAAIGPILSPQLCVFLLNEYGTGNALLLLAAIGMHGLVGAVLLKPLPKRKIRTNGGTENADESALLEQKSTKNMNYIDIQTEVKPSRIKRAGKSMSKSLSLDLLMDWTYVNVILGMTISYVAEQNFNLLAPIILSELAEFSRENVALAMSIMAACDIIGRLIIPIVAQLYNWKPKILYMISLILSCIGRVGLVMFSSKISLVFTTCVIFGVAKGIKAVFQALILPEMVELHRIPSVTALVMTFNGLLSLPIGPLIGYVHDVTSSYVTSLYMTSVLSMTCVAMWILDSIFNIRKKKTSEDDISAQQNNDEIV